MVDGELGGEDYDRPAVHHHSDRSPMALLCYMLTVTSWDPFPLTHSTLVALDSENRWDHIKTRDD